MKSVKNILDEHIKVSLKIHPDSLNKLQEEFPVQFFMKSLKNSKSKSPQKVQSLNLYLEISLVEVLKKLGCFSEEA